MAEGAIILERENQHAKEEELKDLDNSFQADNRYYVEKEGKRGETLKTTCFFLACNSIIGDKRWGRMGA